MQSTENYMKKEGSADMSSDQSFVFQTPWKDP